MKIKDIIYNFHQSLMASVRPIPGSESYFLAGVAYHPSNVHWDDRLSSSMKHGDILRQVHRELQSIPNYERVVVANSGPPTGAGSSTPEEFRKIWGRDYNKDIIKGLARHNRREEGESIRAYARRLYTIHRARTAPPPTPIPSLGGLTIR